jgi:hypothetical protein
MTIWRFLSWNSMSSMSFKSSVQIVLTVQYLNNIRKLSDYFVTEGCYSSNKPQ